jgi:hypothetical protein
MALKFSRIVEPHVIGLDFKIIRSPRRHSADRWLETLESVKLSFGRDQIIQELVVEEFGKKILVISGGNPTHRVTATKQKPGQLCQILFYLFPGILGEEKERLCGLIIDHEVMKLKNGPPYEVRNPVKAGFLGLVLLVN